MAASNMNVNVNDDDYGSDVEGGIVGILKRGTGAGSGGIGGFIGGSLSACLCCFLGGILSLIAKIPRVIIDVILISLLIIITVFTILDWQEDNHQSDEIEKMQCKLDLLMTAVGLDPSASP